jgi:hypothetical protein
MSMRMAASACHVLQDFSAPCGARIVRLLASVAALINQAPSINCFAEDGRDTRPIGVCWSSIWNQPSAKKHPAQRRAGWFG